MNEISNEVLEKILFHSKNIDAEQCCSRFKYIMNRARFRAQWVVRDLLLSEQSFDPIIFIQNLEIQYSKDLKLLVFLLEIYFDPDKFELLSSEIDLTELKMRKAPDTEVINMIFRLLSHCPDLNPYFLIQHYIDIDSVIKMNIKSLENPLLLIAQRLFIKPGHVEVFKFFLEKTPQFVHLDQEKTLRHAAKRGHVELVRILVAYGCNLEIMGNYVILKSALNGHIDTVRYLLNECKLRLDLEELDEPRKLYLKTEHPDVWDLVQTSTITQK